MKKILIVGSANVDLSIHVKQIPAVGETVLGKSMERLPGGKGANQACAVGKLGGIGCFLCAVGSDDAGILIQKSLKEAGMDPAHMKICEKESTGMAVVCVSDRGENNIIVVSGANARCDVDYLKAQRALFHDCDLLLLQMEIPLERVVYAAKRATSLGKTVILNPAPVPENFPEELFQYADYLTPNEVELFKLANMKAGSSMAEVLQAGKRLLRKGANRLLVTLGGKGALYLGKNEERLFAPPEVPVIDTTAAGDTFNAAFAVKLAEGWNVGKAVDYANCASSVTVSRKGAQASIPTAYQVQEFLFNRKIELSPISLS